MLVVTSLSFCSYSISNLSKYFIMLEWCHLDFSVLLLSLLFLVWSVIFSRIRVFQGLLSLQSIIIFSPCFCLYLAKYWCVIYLNYKINNWQVFYFYLLEEALIGYQSISSKKSIYFSITANITTKLLFRYVIKLFMAY